MRILMRSMLVLALLLAVTAIVPALAEHPATATDLTPATEGMPMAYDMADDCLFNGYELKKLHDQSYMTFWGAPVKFGERALIITAPEGQTIGGVVLKWRKPPVALNVQAQNANGDWETFADYDGKYYEQYYPVNGLHEVRFATRDDPEKEMAFCEIVVLTEGVLPKEIQLWRDPAEKVDMMVIHGHPDDELLWFGGLLPYYGGELQKELLLVCSTPAGYHRRLELLDALWTCGVTIYPSMGNFTDKISNNMQEILNFWGEDAINAYVVGLYRRYKPDVVVTQDVNGEYGHGVHRAISHVARMSVGYAADPTKYPESAEKYGTWEVRKMYVHLYPENQITMDWQVPLSRFDGTIAQDVSREAFLWHKSQQERGWAVNDGGIHDNTLFGLYHTTVGVDVIGGDMFENIE